MAKGPKLEFATMATVAPSQEVPDLEIIFCERISKLGGSGGGREFELKFEVKCCWAFLVCLQGKFMQKIGLKALGKYSASFWTNNFTIQYWKTI